MHASQHLPGVLAKVQSPLNHYGYAAVAALVLLEDFGVPVPGETILIVGAIDAGTGRLNVWLVGLIAFLAAVTGDNIGFAIGHYGGEPLVERFGRYIFLTPARVAKAKDFFERRGGWIVTVARFIEGLRQANGIIAGLVGMPWLQFLAFNALGAALWVALWTCVGYFSGSHIDSIYHTATHYETYFGILVGVVVVLLVVRTLRRRRAHRDAPPPDHHDAPPPDHNEATPPA